MKKLYVTCLFVVLDIVAINAALFLSYWLKFDGAIPSDQFIVYKEVFIYFSLVKIILLFYSGIYKSLWRYASINELFRIAIISGFGNMACAALVSFFDGSVVSEFNVGAVPKSIYIICWILDTAIIGGVRIIFRVLSHLNVKTFLKNISKKRCLIIGAGEAGAQAIKEMKLNESLLRMPVAVVDDDISKKGKNINGIPIVGDRLDIPAVVIHKKIDEIILAIPSMDNKSRSEIIEICNRTGVEVKTLPGTYELITGNISLSQLRHVEISDLLGREPVKLDMETIGGYLHGAVVAVTGGGGSIGSELCRQISKYSPKQLIILDVYENSTYEVQNELISKYPELDLKVLITTITDRDGIFAIFEKYLPDVVFHAAAHKHVPLLEDSPREAIKNNVFGTLNVVQAAERFGVKRFVQISTDKAVNPTNVMGATKRLCEMIIQAHKNSFTTKFVAVRFGNVLGSNGSVIPKFKKQIEGGGPVTVTHKDMIRYFMTIPEAVELVMQAGGMAEGGEIFVLDMGEPVKIVKLAEELIRLSGYEPNVDIEIKYTGLRPGEKLYEELLMAEEGLKDTPHKKIFITNPLNIERGDLEKKLFILKESIKSSDEEIIFAIEDVVPTYKRDKSNEERSKARTDSRKQNSQSVIHINTANR